MVRNRIQYSIKRICDRILAVFMLVVLSPVFLILSIVIKADNNGPVLFRQKRLGYRGKIFFIYKFRTMVPGAIDLRNPDGSTYNAADDTRVTRIGKILRTSSLDELPQLFNILKGDMSFIGPRPDLPEFYEKYTSRQKHKVDVLPGVTGLAQISGRNEISHAERIEHDLIYIESYSLLLDLKIIFKTVVNVMFAKGLYVRQDKD
ncbi:sugar transferase [Syntrophotalea carbinolica]|nr:sugar transferase [Syntrophotalea carbinolica]